MSKIQEAYMAVVKSPAKDPTVMFRAPFEEAIRALMLAVMEAALMVGSADHIDDFDEGAAALRREIEELGK